MDLMCSHFLLRMIGESLSTRALHWWISIFFNNMIHLSLYLLLFCGAFFLLFCMFCYILWNLPFGIKNNYKHKSDLENVLENTHMGKLCATNWKNTSATVIPASALIYQSLQFTEVTLWQWLRLPKSAPHLYNRTVKNRPWSKVIIFKRF